MVVFYAGNKLSAHGASMTGVETLTPQLIDLGFQVIPVSDKKNAVMRLVDMTTSFLKNRKHIDVVLIDTYSRKAFWYAVVLGALCRKYNIPYFPILHGGGLPYRLEESPRISKRLFSQSAMNISPSQSFVDLFSKAGYRVICIPNNIDISQYKFKERKLFKLKLLWVRSFHEIYNPALAVLLINELVKMGYDAELCMVGPDKDGSLDKCSELVNSLGINNNVVFTGKLTKSDWNKMSEDYDIFINTTNHDNTPVSVIEAMALGLAVVSTNVGGLPYLLSNGEDALLVNPDDLKQMVDAVIDTHLNTDNTCKRVIKARRKVESFDWTIVKSQWMDLLKPYNND